MPEKSAPDHERVREMQTWHGGKLVKVPTLAVFADPDTLGMRLSNGVLEAEAFRKQPGRHAWVNSEGEESNEVTQSHCASRDRKLVEGWRRIVVPGYEAGNS